MTDLKKKIISPLKMATLIFKHKSPIKEEITPNKGKRPF
jgi:hypothetical protein